MKATKHLVIPDTQVKEGVPLEHLRWLGEYIVEKRPDVLVIIGDWYDFPSLSSYDIGKKSFEGRRYKKDLTIGEYAMDMLMTPIRNYNKQLKRKSSYHYNPRKVATLGNHEYRVLKVIESDPKLDGTISLDDLCFRKYGWEVHNFLNPVTIDGVTYCHYFPSGQLGRPCTSARSILSKYHTSCVAGHQQGRDIAYGKRADGSNITSIICGSFYQHDEDYLNAFTNQHWRGFYMLHEVNNGSFDEMAVSIGYLSRKYS